MIIVLIGDSEFEKERLIEQFLEKTLGDRKDDPLARKIIFANDWNGEKSCYPFSAVFVESPIWSCPIH